MTTARLRCYVCGKVIVPRLKFALVSAATNETDRVFVTHPGDCLTDVDKDQPSMIVRSQEGRKP